METLTDPQTGDTGSPDDLAHYADKGEIMEALVNGTRIQALCGVWFIPQRDPEGFPICQACKDARESILNMRSVL